MCFDWNIFPQDCLFSLFVRDEQILELEIHHRWTKQGQIRFFFIIILFGSSLQCCVVCGFGLCGLVFFLLSLNNLSDDPCQGFAVKSLWEHLINFGRKPLILHLDILFCSLRFAVPSANSKSDISLTDAAFFNWSWTIKFFYINRLIWQNMSSLRFMFVVWVLFFFPLRNFTLSCNWYFLLFPKSLFLLLPFFKEQYLNLQVCSFEKNGEDRGKSFSLFTCKSSFFIYRCGCHNSLWKEVEATPKWNHIFSCTDASLRSEQWYALGIIPPDVTFVHLIVNGSNGWHTKDANAWQKICGFN